MPDRSPKPATAPTLRCHAHTASALGAVPLREANDAKKFGPAFIPIRGHDGTLWAWPIEAAFLAAIERQ